MYKNIIFKTSINIVNSVCESITILIPRLNPLAWIQHLAKVRPWLLARDVELASLTALMSEDTDCPKNVNSVRAYLWANVEYECCVRNLSHSLWFSDGYIRKFAPLQPQTLGGSCFFRRQRHLNNWHIPGLLIIGVIWSTPSETLGNKTYHSSCPDLMSSARFEVTWLNKNIQFISGPLKLIEWAVKKSSGRYEFLSCW